MNNIVAKFLFLVIMLISVNNLHAQEKIHDINGLIISSAGYPLASASIRVQKSSIGTWANTDGKFDLHKVPNYSVLIFSCVGFLTQKQIVKGNNYFRVVLQPKEYYDSLVITADSGKVASFKEKGKLLLEDKDEGNGNSSSFTMIEVNAYFPGGLVSLKKKMMEFITYPDSAIANKIEGEVRIGFTINPDGDVINPVIIKGVNPLLDREVLAAIQKTGKWSRAMQNGRNLNEYKELSILFKIPD